MSAPNIDFGKLTQEETAEVALEALGELTLDNRVQAVLKAFGGDERGELTAWLNDDEAEKEA